MSSPRRSRRANNAHVHDYVAEAGSADAMELEERDHVGGITSPSSGEKHARADNAEDEERAGDISGSGSAGAARAEASLPRGGGGGVAPMQAPTSPAESVSKRARVEPDQNAWAAALKMAAEGERSPRHRSNSLCAKEASHVPTRASCSLTNSFIHAPTHASTRQRLHPSTNSFIRPPSKHAPADSSISYQLLRPPDITHIHQPTSLLALPTCFE
jgi:hypothetical protein